MYWTYALLLDAISNSRVVIGHTSGIKITLSLSWILQISTNRNFDQFIVFSKYLFTNPVTRGVW